MQSLIRTEWLATIERVAADLGVDPDDPETWRQALVRVWTLLPLAPVTLHGTYSTLPEGAIVAVADRLYPIGDEAPAPLDLSGCAMDEQRLIELAGWLRAAERKIAEVDLGAFSGDPNEDWYYEVDGEGFFLAPVPRSAWRPPYLPGAPTRPYTRRALLRFRVMPAVIGGLRVRFTDYRRPGHKRPELVFGASLFAGFDVVSEDESDERHFLAVEAVGPTGEAVRGDIAEAARHGCSVHVFPELTVMTAMRAEVPSALARAEWDAVDGPARPGPDFVVAGSWHERYPDGIWNEAVVYSSCGDELLRFRKLFRFRDDRGRYEKIEPGDGLEVLVTGRGLYGFGVCLDFCQKATPVLTGLDVDWMVIPSCGDWRTMRDHLSSANELQVRFDTRSFVVQQVYPKRDDACVGYILPAPARVEEPTELDLRVSQSFTSYRVLP